MANPQIENGYIKIANELVDKFCHYRISGEEWLVLWVILKKTYGFNKKSDMISLSQFSIETGLKRPTVSRAIRKLVSKKILGSIKNDTGFCTTYSFLKDYHKWTHNNKKEGGIKKDNRVVSLLSHTKDNITKDKTTTLKSLSLRTVVNKENKKIPPMPQSWLPTVMEYFGNLNGWDKSGNKQVAYRRFARTCKDLFLLSEGDIEKVKNTILWMSKQGYTWSLDTCVKKWYDANKKSRAESLPEL